MGSPRPAGTVIDIGHTRDLRPGDHIFIQGIGWLASWKFGNEIDAVVTSVDADGRKIGMRLPDGSQKSFDGGSKDELLKKLADAIGYEKVEIIRPQEEPPPAAPVARPAAPRISVPADKVSPYEDEGRAMLMSVGLEPAAFKAYTTYENANVSAFGAGWLVYTVNGNGVHRLWKVVGDGSVKVVASDLGQERGTVIPASEAKLPSSHVIFMPPDDGAAEPSGPARAYNSKPSSNGSAHPAVRDEGPSMLVGGIVLAGLAGLTWWILKNKNRDGDED